MSRQQASPGVIRAGLVGATGYTGQELLRLLLAHPAVELAALASVRRAGQHVSDALPRLRGTLDVRFRAPADTADCDVVFFALPHGQAMAHVPGLLQAGVRVIDLSADFRLPEALWRDTYGEPHRCPELLPEAVYGLPELYPQRLAQARLVANPGCYPTATLLATAPLLQAKVIRPQLVVDAKSGVTGAGRKTTEDLLYTEIDGTPASLRTAAASPPRGDHQRPGQGRCGPCTHLRPPLGAHEARLAGQHLCPPRRRQGGRKGPCWKSTMQTNPSCTCCPPAPVQAPLPPWAATAACWPPTTLRVICWYCFRPSIILSRVRPARRYKT